MFIEDALKEGKNLKPIDSYLEINEIENGFEAILYLVFQFGYKFQIDSVLGFDIEHLNQSIRLKWGIEPNYKLN